MGHRSEYRPACFSVQHLTRLKSRCSQALMPYVVPSSSKLTDGCWNWVLCKYRTEVPVSLLVVTQGRLSFHRGHSQVSVTRTAATGSSQHRCRDLQGQQVRHHCCLESLWLLLRTDLTRSGVPRIIFLLINLKPTN